MSACRISTAALGAAIGLLAYLPAGAATVDRYDQQGASSVCQPALPSQAASLRSSPMGLTNQGTEMAFVTCTLQGDNTPAGRGSKLITADVSSSGSASGVITCTLVDGLGVAGNGTATYTTKSVNVFAGASGSVIQWEPAEVVAPPGLITVPAIQCGLPPAATLHYVTRHYVESVGN